MLLLSKEPQLVFAAAFATCAAGKLALLLLSKEPQPVFAAAFAICAAGKLAKPDALPDETMSKAILCMPLLFDGQSSTDLRNVSFAL
ncbi:MAG: hypothetical protein H7838_09840 [Magnetococcus sp. DMHC-8]